MLVSCAPRRIVEQGDTMSDTRAYWMFSTHPFDLSRSRLALFDTLEEAMSQLSGEDWRESDDEPGRWRCHNSSESFYAIIDKREMTPEQAAQWRGLKR